VLQSGEQGATVCEGKSRGMDDTVKLQRNGEVIDLIPRRSDLRTLLIDTNNGGTLKGALEAGHESDGS
jgi:hypothetical protein